MLFLLAAFTAGLTGCVTNPFLPLMGLHVHVEKPFSICTSSRNLGWGYLSHPFVYKFADDLIVVQYNLAGDGVVGAIPELAGKAPAVTYDGGQVWQYGTNVITSRFDGTSVPLNGSGKIITSHGVLTCAPFQVKGSQAWSTTCWIEDGKVVGKPFTSLITVSNLVSNIWVYEGAELTNGDLVIVGYAQTNGSPLSITVLLRSSDRGHTFAISTIATHADAPWGVEGANEPALVLLPDGELLCVMRTGGPGYGGRNGFSYPLLEARSRDGGKTWKHRKMSISGVMPKLLLMSNGVLALATGRSGNALYFSLDGGRTWPSQIDLTPADVQTSGYCDVVEVSPGRLLAVYDMYDTDPKGIWLWEPKEVNGVFGVFVDVRRRFAGGTR